MPVHNFDLPAGRIEYVSIDSRALRDNMLGDPATRTVAVYLPPGYDDGDTDYPLFVDLAGFTGSGLKRLSWQSFGESVPQRLDRLVADGRMGPVIGAFPDCFTSLGGNQYINSAAMGRWEDFLLDETLPRLEESFRVRKGAANRAVFGKSSGGYGAIVQGLRHGDRWGGVACHSGDIGFELVYFRDMPATLDVLARHDGDPQRFLDHLREARKIGGGEFHALMLLAMSATYDPDPGSPMGIRLPVDPHTCERVDERWDNWLRHDPLCMVDRAECRDSLRALRALFIDCGFRDQYVLHYGARAFVRKLEAAGIEYRYEEFDDNHSGIDYRLDVSLPFLYGAIAG
ncbi:MAG: enterochelin esterase [bacterium]|nr:enterochelin esterase [bacterium]